MGVDVGEVVGVSDDLTVSDRVKVGRGVSVACVVWVGVAEGTGSEAGGRLAVQATSQTKRISASPHFLFT